MKEFVDYSERGVYALITNPRSGAIDVARVRRITDSLLEVGDNHWMPACQVEIIEAETFIGATREKLKRLGYIDVN